MNRKREINAPRAPQAPQEQLDVLRVVWVGKIVAFLLTAVVCIIILVSNWNAYLLGTAAWYVLLPASLVFLAASAVRTWALKSFNSKIAFYVIDILLLLVLTIFSDGSLISLLYIAILSQFYLEQQSLMGNIAMCVVSIGLFLITFTVSSAVVRASTDIASIFSRSFSDIIIILLHFLIVNFSLQMYRKNKEITATLKELGDTNEKLIRLNAEMREITALEERQRIAKDIHDTAGHSITTVIMQTEAAKLILDEDPEEARRNIAAANLQAKHALEELRESVHLLSGATEQLTLREALLEIVHESTDGTGITIRYEIDDVTLCDAKRRFLCNSLKEGISNGLRHGSATAFWFSFKREGGRVAFLLSDNGTGMEIGSLKEGFGLSGMQKRAAALGGDVWFATEPDEGFEVHILLPLDGGEETK